MLSHPAQVWMGGPAGEAARAAAVALVLLVLLCAAEFWYRRWAPPAEWTRKLVHCGAGLLATAFPWLFDNPWPVLALGIAFGLLVRLGRRWGLLRSIHGVRRRSDGDLYYLAAVFLLFVLGRGWPVFYLVSLLVLVLSDTLAALLGSAYGRWAYRVERSRRSVEGSAVFFLATFLCVHLPLLLLTPMDRLAAVLVALQIALLVTSFEAISLKGSDNLIVPLATFYLLVKLTPQAPDRLALLIASELLILGGMALLAWRSRLLSVSGAVAAHLFFYGAWALRGPAWVLAPALALAGLLLVHRYTPGGTRPQGRYQVLAVFYVGAVAMTLCLLDNTLDTLARPPEWLRAGLPCYAAYTGALAAQLALLAYTGTARGGLDVRRALLFSMGAFAVVAPAALGHMTRGPGTWLVASVTCLSGTAAYLTARRLWGPPPTSALDLRLQSGSIAGAAVLSLLVHAWAGFPV